MLCRVRVLTPNSSTENLTFLEPRDVPEITDQIRKSWIQGLQKFFVSSAEHQQIRPLDFQLCLSGTVEHQPISPTPSTPETVYPPSYRIPPETIAELATKDKVQRSEYFALGSLIYEIYAREAPFEHLSEHEIQDMFRRAHFPAVTHIPQWRFILSCWSLEFANALHAMSGKRSPHRPFSALETGASNVFSKSNSRLPSEQSAPKSKLHSLGRSAKSYISAHPVRFGFQVTGAVVGLAAIITVPVLGAAGFGSLGPVAGSSAAAWQASMGAVEVGSLFAWCQGAAMGGAAVNGIIAAGAAGGGVLLGSTAIGELMDQGMDEAKKEELMDLFRSVFRKGEDEKKAEVEAEKTLE